MEFKICNKQEDLEKQIIFLAQDLERRAKEISIDWDKHILEINFNAILKPNETLQWEIKKIYSAYKN